MDIRNLLPPEFTKTDSELIKDSPEIQAFFKIADAILDNSFDLGKREGFMATTEITEAFRKMVHFKVANKIALENCRFNEVTALVIAMLTAYDLGVKEGKQLK